MKGYITIAVTILLVVGGPAFAQKFSLTCLGKAVHKEEAPVIFLYAEDNLFDDNPFAQRISLRVSGDSIWNGELLNTRPVFFQLNDAQLLALPGQQLTGVLQQQNQYFITSDTNNINWLLNKSIREMEAITVRYNKGASFSEFTAYFDLLKKYTDSVIAALVSPSSRAKYNLSNAALSALRQFYTTKLAHFSVLPVLLKNAYTDKLLNLVQDNIQIGESRYWLETQSGRIFLKTFFADYLLPVYGYDLNKCLAFANYFRARDIKKFVTFFYFDRVLNKGDQAISLQEIKNNFSVYQNSGSFTGKEKTALAGIKDKISAKDKNIMELFASQQLVNMNGVTLTGQQKTDLLTDTRPVIIDYWASWCAPCLDKISRLASGEVMLNGRKYKLVFISVDKEQQAWQKVKYPALTSANSFRITNTQSPSFFTSFRIRSFPRLFLIENYVLKSDNFSY